MVNTSRTQGMNCISFKEQAVTRHPGFLRNGVKVNGIRGVTIDSLAGEKRQRGTLYSKADSSRIEWSKFGCSLRQWDGQRTSKWGVVDHVTPGFRFAPTWCLTNGRPAYYNMTLCACIVPNGTQAITLFFQSTTSSDSSPPEHMAVYTRHKA